MTDIHVINWTIEEAKLLKAERPQPTGADPTPSLDQSLVGPEDDLSGRATEPVDSVVKSSPIESTAETAPVVPPSIELSRPGAATETRTVNKVTWAQVGRVTEPGRYMLRFGWVTISVEDLAIWQQYPDAVFTLYTTLSAIGTEEKVGEEFRLGIVDLRENWNVPQNEK